MEEAGGRRRPCTVPSEWRVLAWLGVFTLLYVYFYPVLVIALVFAVALLLAAVLHPTVTWLWERAHVPRAVSAFLILLALLAVIGAVLYWAVPLIISQTTKLIDSVPALYESYQRAIAGLVRRHPAFSGLQHVANPFRVQHWLELIIGWVNAYGPALGEAVVAFVLVVVASIYTLAAPVPLISGLLVLWPPSEREHVGQAVNCSIDRVRLWMGSQILAMVSVGLLAGMSLWALDVPFAALFGLVAGLLEIVPTLGPIVGAVGPVMAALAIAPVKGLWVIGAFVVIQQIENNVLIPLVIGSSLRMHPVPILFVAFVMAALFGLLGVFVAVPLLAVAQAVYEEFSEAPPGQRESVEQEARAALQMPPTPPTPQQQAEKGRRAPNGR